MDSPKGAVWLGHCRTGGRFYLKADELHPGINVLGIGADAIAAVLARSCKETGLNPLVLDLDGRLSDALDGCMKRWSLGGFLYDSMKLDEKSLLHAELAASAYTIALNLSFEQEAFLNSAMQLIGLEQGVASPASLADQLNSAGEYRGHTADELRGRFGALKSLNLIGETGAVKQMLGGGCVASFADAESHQAAEVAAMLFIAKMLALGASGARLPDVLILNEANRVFSNLPLARHGNRLLTALLSSTTSKITVSEHMYGLDHHFIDASPVRIISSCLWNDVTAGKSPLGGLYSPHYAGSRRDQFSGATQSLVLTPNMFVLQDSARGYEEVFVPRMFGRVEVTEASYPDAAPQKDDSHLVKQILEIASSYSEPTRGSIVSYLSSDNPREEVERVIDRLQSQGFLAVTGKDVKRDNPLHTISVTPAGYDLLRRLR